MRFTRYKIKIPCRDFREFQEQAYIRGFNWAYRGFIDPAVVVAQKHSYIYVILILSSGCEMSYSFQEEDFLAVSCQEIVTLSEIP
jgi:hypothetical protein